ncbi:MAG: tetratricopeptide repeat protein, partial [Candidatus Omnitrophica bacterium]|nr:tetratricopeptide repeat protein [Candidatus Omnitrophota bacterium]
MRKILVFTLLLLSSCSCAFADSAQEVYQRGNELYRNGKYEEAIEEYSKVAVIHGIRNSAIYYNLGNAYFKVKKLGRAIASYERAYALNPRDEDIRANLDYANTFLVDTFDGRRGVISYLVERINGLYNLNEIMLATSIFYLILIVLIILSSKRLMPYAAAAAIIALVLFSLKSYDANTRKAIAVALTVEAKSGPGDDYSVQFVAHEGVKFRIIE